MENYEFVTQWVMDTVKEQYAADIALVVSHTTLRMDGGRPAIGYFVPVTSRGDAFARTFLLNGEGFDIWGIPWERLERFAELEEYNITVLADGEILYAKDAEWARRFEMLQARLRSNLADGSRMRACALKAFAQAKELYMEMCFSGRSDLRMLAGYVLDYLARAVAFSRHRYFQKSQTAQLEELRQFCREEELPEGFCALYLGVIRERDEMRQTEKCRRAITAVREYLAKIYPDHAPQEHNYQDLADWYAELSYTWLRIRRYAAEGDYVRVYMWGIYLQSELNGVCEDFCLEKQELMEYYDCEHLDAFAGRAGELEAWIRAQIAAGGGIIREYGSREAFLHEEA